MESRRDWEGDRWRGRERGTAKREVGLSKHDAERVDLRLPKGDFILSSVFRGGH